MSRRAISLPTVVADCRGGNERGETLRVSVAIRSLVARGGSPLGRPNRVPAFVAGDVSEPSRSQLCEMLRMKNGFYAFYSALHVFPAGEGHVGLDVDTWNSPGLWRYEFGDLTDGVFFFAEDIFGEQFGIRNGRVERFNPEQANYTDFAADVEGWAAKILSSHRTETGWPLAKAWQSVHGPIPPGTRLLPAVPFFAGGEYTVENVNAVEAVEAMQYRGFIAMKTRHLPVGAKIVLDFE